MSCCAFALHVAIFMGMTNPAVAATQFTAYMAISNLAISYSNLWHCLLYTSPSPRDRS